MIALVTFSHVHVHSAPYVQSRISGTVMWPPKNRCLETSTISIIVIGKEEDVLDMMEATESLTLDGEAMAAKEVLLEATKAVCCGYYDRFCSLQKTQELQGGEQLPESVDLLLCNPPINYAPIKTFRKAERIFSAL